MDISEIENYYSKVNILQELIKENKGEDVVEYLGDENQAKEYLLKKYSKTPDDDNPTENEKTLGEILFNGEKIYPDLDCTDYGKENLN